MSLEAFLKFICSKNAVGLLTAFNTLCTSRTDGSFKFRL